jgi:hypothetical protein
VLSCLDAFLLDHNILDLGVIEIRGLRDRLGHLAQFPPTGPLCSSAVGNTCFDALACITALEARLCRALDRTEVRMRVQAHRCAANDE